MSGEELEKLCAQYPSYAEAPLWLQEAFDLYWSERGR